MTLNGYFALQPVLDEHVMGLRVWLSDIAVRKQAQLRINCQRYKICSSETLVSAHTFHVVIHRGSLKRDRQTGELYSQL